MKKRKFKPFVKKSVLGITFMGLILSIVLINNTGDMEVNEVIDDYRYVNSSIFTNNMPVIAEEKHIIKPYSSDTVEIYKNYYDQSKTDEEKEKSLIFYNDTYIQNSGILYKSNNKFDILCILDGTVIDVKNDEVLGNVVEVKHNNNVVSRYQGLDIVNVQKDQIINQGFVIGTSGKLKLGEVVENGLLFELVKDGKYINPLDYFDKKISEL